MEKITIEDFRSLSKQTLSQGQQVHICKRCALVRQLNRQLIEFFARLSDDELEGVDRVQLHVNLFLPNPLSDGEED